jgi:hypothetical protein
VAWYCVAGERFERAHEVAGSSGGSSSGGGGGIFSHLIDNLSQLMMVFIKGIGTNLANLSGVPFRFDPLIEKHPLCTKSELTYKLVQRFSWQVRHDDIRPFPAP